MRITIHDPKMARAKIWLDGNRVRWVTEADDQYGYVDRYEVDDFGALVYRDGKLQTVRDRGVVYIVIGD